MKLLKSRKMYLLGMKKVKINVLNMSTRKTRNKVKKRKNKGLLKNKIVFEACSN